MSESATRLHPSPTAGPYHGCHHRNPATGHAQHDLAAMQNGLGAQIRILPQLLEVREITTRRKRATRPGDHRRAGLAVLAKARPHMRQADMERIVDGVERIGPIQRDDAQRPVGLDVDFRWQIVQVSSFRSSRKRSSHSQS
jgi:hypothetical protein